jgi:hypothetical protein
MVLAELLSLGLYILSLIVLKDYFGKSQMKCGLNTNQDFSLFRCHVADIFIFTETYHHIMLFAWAGEGIGLK